MGPCLRCAVTTKRLLLVVALSAVATYLLAIGGTFTGDDGHLIAGNALVHGWSGVWSAFGAPYWPPAFGGALYRPLPVATYAADWMLSGGSAPWFHAVNILWHAGASVLVAVLAGEWVGKREKGSGTRAALVGGLVFAVHPVHVEAVANIVGRAELMAAVFTLLAVHAIVQRGNLWLGLVAWICGLLSKENAAVAPALILTAWWLGIGVRPPRRTMITAGGVWMVAALAYAGLREAVLGHYASLWSPAPVFVGLSWLTVRLTAVAVILDVWRLLLFPLTLRVDYSPAERTAVASATDPRFLLGIGLAVVLGVLVKWMWKRGAKVEAYGLLWIGIAFLPVANILFPIGVLIAERTLYLPSVGLALIAGALAARVPPKLGYGLLTVVVLGAGAWRSVLRIPVWHDNITFAQSIVRDSPSSYVGQMAAAGVMLERGRPTYALEAARLATVDYPLDPRPYLIGAHAALKLRQFRTADSLMALANQHCRPCEGIYQAQIADALQLGDSAAADSLRAHQP